MADLLECLVQIRALADSPARAEPLLARFPAAAAEPLATLRRLAEAELALAVRIRQILTEERPALLELDVDRLAARADDDPEHALALWRARRQENCALLGSCSAVELERSGTLGPREATLADLVALALANDTETTGELRSLLEENR